MRARCTLRGLGLALALAACSGEDDAARTEGPESDPSSWGSLRRAAADAGKMLGTAVSSGALANDATYRELVAREFDSVTPENATKWGPLAPTASSYDWARADAIVDYAIAHGQAIKGHALVWHTQAPEWAEALEAGELAAAIKAHIETTLRRYRGRIRAWDVVNEAVSPDTPSGYRENVFWQKLGPEYIEHAFRWARDADPDVLLYYNEFGIEWLGPKADITYGLMKDLLDKGVPIDGIGFQGHLALDRYQAESDLRANIRRFAELGLKVNISELDARTLSMPADTALRLDAQRLAFQQVVGACVVEPGCEGVTFWGLTDRYSWLNQDGPEDALLFDRDYQPKPAYQGVLDGLSGKLPVGSENLLSNGDLAERDEGWTAQGGELAIVDEMDGPAACVSGRTIRADGLLQEGLLDALVSGGPMAFAATVRASGTEAARVEAALVVTEQDGTTREISLGLRFIPGSEWNELAGNVGLGFATPPSALSLRIFGPRGDIELCVRDVSLRRLQAGP